MADKPAGKRSAVGEGLSGRDVLAEFKNEAVGTIVGLRAEQAWDNDARGNRAVYRAVGITWIREIDVVHDERAFRGRVNKLRDKSRRVCRRVLEVGQDFGVGFSFVLTHRFKLFER